jgi:hypothetical protein
VKKRAFFVTYVIILGLLALLAVNSVPLLQAVMQAKTPSAGDLAQLGNERIQQSFQLQRQLQASYGIEIAPSSSDKSPAQISWQAWSKTQRRDIQAKLAMYLTLVNQVLIIDAQKNITIENRSVLLRSRDRAETLQKVIEGFERVYGENYHPATRARVI